MGYWNQTTFVEPLKWLYRTQFKNHCPGHMPSNAYYRNLKWTFEDLLPCYCYAIKNNSGTVCSQVASAGKGADVSELQAQHCMTTEQWTWLLCNVSVIPANILSLQELNEIIGIKLLTLRFLEILALTLNFPRGGKCPFLPLRTPIWTTRENCGLNT